MKKFAFIDVQNTETTTLKVLRFALDYEKLFSYLKNKWKCEKIFFYPGIQFNDEVRGELFDKLTNVGAIVRPRYSTSRFSTKLRNLLTKYSQKVLYLELDDWKMRIKLDSK